MAYGNFDQAISNGLSLRSWSAYNPATGRNETYKFYVYKTNAFTQAIAPAVSSVRVGMDTMNPNSNVCSPSSVVAKVNANYMDTSSSGNAFYGIFYSGGQLSKDGIVGVARSTADYYQGLEEPYWYRNSPSFCVNQNGYATIRWFSNENPNGLRMTLNTGMDTYPIILSGQHCLIHHSVPVFEGTTYSHEGVAIADWANLNYAYNHHNEVLGGYNSKIKRRRTFLGHANGSFFLVLVSGGDDWGPETTGIDLRMGARMMSDMGCDYALNMDGGSPSQMRVNGQWVHNAYYNIGSCICAYNK